MEEQKQPFNPLLAVLAALAALFFVFPLAWLLARGQFRGKGLLRGLVTLPMVLPPRGTAGAGRAPPSVR
jgi:ABC-type molybdate transport system permease subunit